MPPFLAVCGASLLGCGMGKPCKGFALNEVDTGEKPWTTDPVLIRPSEETEVSEFRWSLGRVVFVDDVATVVPEIHESVEFCICLPQPSSFSCVASLEDIAASKVFNGGREASMLGESGPSSAFACIPTTIFSRVLALRCDSLPLDFDRALSSSSEE